jgi:stress response protein SCP2
MQLTKGQNCGLALGPVWVSCQWTETSAADADLSALLLAGGKVRNDADFVFYNQAVSIDGAVRHEGKRRVGGRIEDRISIDPVSLGDDVDTVALALSLDGAGRNLSDLGAVDVAVLDAAGSLVAAFTIDDLTTETAAITFEIYRRDAAWKVRAVGQGYHDGLAGLARDFGVSVDDEPEPAAQAPAPPQGPPPINWTNPPVPAGYEL